MYIYYWRKLTSFSYHNLCSEGFTKFFGCLHTDSRNVVNDFRNLFGNVQKFEINIEIWKLEIRLKQNLIGFAAPAILCTIKTCKN